MKALVALVVLALSACATTGDAMADRARAREARDAGQLLAVVGAGAFVGAPVAVVSLVAPDEGAYTSPLVAGLVAIPVVACGMAAYAAGMNIAAESARAVE